MSTPNSRIEISPAQETLPPVEPTTLVIFGGSGDLARRRLIPALYNLLLDGLMPSHYVVLGLGRKPMSDEEFRATVREGVVKHSRQALIEDTWAAFADHLFYMAGENDDPHTYVKLKARAEELERTFQLPGNRVFYLSIPPSSFTPVCEGLSSSGLATKDNGHAPYARIIVEKPVGRDLKSGREINALTGRVFNESQIFRIDHYLGKETVQNLMVVRFANSIFEPIWNRNYIDHIQITVAEEVPVGRRGGYYDKAGVLRDMFQNHLLQLLMVTAMEAPVRFNASAVRNEKVKVLEAIRPLEPAEVAAAVRARQWEMAQARLWPRPADPPI